MKKSLTPLPRSGGCSRTGRWFQQALVMAAVLCGMGSLQAAISVGIGGTGVLQFNSAPLVTEWSSRNVQPNLGAAITDVAGLNAPMQTNLASAIATLLPTIAAPGIAQNNNAGYDGTNLRIHTRPTGNSYQILMGQFQNNSGGAAAQITIGFDGTINAPLAGEAAGWGVFYSLSGQTNEWVPIPELSGIEFSFSTNVTVTLASNWLSGNILYLAFADDNANGITDPGYAIDNFQLTAVPLNVTPIVITNSPANTTVAERAPVTFTVVAGGLPRNYHWRSNGVPVSAPNAPSYTIPSTPFSANGAVYSVVVSNSLGGVTSAGATLTVTPDTTPPTALSARANTNGTEIVITFSEAMNPLLDGGFLV